MARDCIEFRGHIGNAGYGLCYDPVLKRTGLAHRVAYRSAKGELAKGLVVSHSCNNKACINPDHLSQTTQSANVQKSYDDGLQINPHRKLDDENALFIFNSTLSQRVLAHMFDISQKAVWLIKHKETYGKIHGSCGV